MHHEGIREEVFSQLMRPPVAVSVSKPPKREDTPAPKEFGSLHQYAVSCLIKCRSADTGLDLCRELLAMWDPSIDPVQVREIKNTVTMVVSTLFVDPSMIPGLSKHIVKDPVFQRWKSIIRSIEDQISGKKDYPQ